MDQLFDKTKTALVIIDLQKGVASMETQPYAAKDVIANSAKMAASFRKNNMPVFLVRVETSPDSKDRLNPIIDGENPWANRQFPPDYSEIIPELGPEKTDFIITKKQWGAFYGTDLELQLRRRNIDTIILCGIATGFGVESTARFAFEYGFQQIFVEDAMSGRNSEEHQNSIERIFPRMGRIRKTEHILNSL